MSPAAVIRSLLLAGALAAAGIVPPGAAQMTLKERSSGKAGDGQRVNDCKVPVEKRGEGRRPTDCARR